MTIETPESVETAETPEGGETPKAKAAARRRLTPIERRDKKVAIAKREVERARKSAQRVFKRRDKAVAAAALATSQAAEVEREIQVLEATLKWEQERPVGVESASPSDTDVFPSEADEAPVAAPVDEDFEDNAGTEVFEDDEDEDEDEDEDDEDEYDDTEDEDSEDVL